MDSVRTTCLPSCDAAKACPASTKKKPARKRDFLIAGRGNGRGGVEPNFVQASLRATAAAAPPAAARSNHMGSFSIWHWLIVLLVVVLVFGTKKLRNLGSDLGTAVKGFRDGMKSEEDKSAQAKAEIPPGTGQTIEGEARKETPRV